MRQLLLYIILACGATVAAQTTTTIKLTQLETSPVIESSRAGQVGLTNSDGKQRYAQFVEVDLNPIGFVPTATGNTQNYSEFVTDPNGDKWYIDWQGRGYKFPGSAVDKNGYYGGNTGNGGNGTIPSSTTSTLTNQLTFLIDTSALTGTVPIRIKVNKPGDFEDFMSMVSGSSDSLFFYRSDANFVIRYTSGGDFALVADSKLMLQGDSIQMVGVGTHTGGGSIFLKQTAGGTVKKQLGINSGDLNFSPVLDINAGTNVTVTDTNGVYTISATGGGGGGTYYPGEGIAITNDTISVDTVQRLSFRTDQTYSGGVGTFSWDDVDGTLQLGLKGGNVALQVGEENVQLVKHADNTGLENGKVVYLTGSSGTNMEVRYAQANSEATSANTIGLMTETVTGGNKGFCTTFGIVRNINTNNLTEGGIVWLSKDTAGAMTAVRPTAPNHGTMIGLCVKKHATQGEIFVEVQNGYELNELHNVYAPSPTNNQGLVYKSANNRWEAAEVDTSLNNEGRLIGFKPSNNSYYTISSSTTGSSGITLFRGSGIGFSGNGGSPEGGDLTISNTGDLDIGNEGILGVDAGAANTSVITSNSPGATGVTVSGGTGIAVTETTSSNGGTVTITNSAPDQTVTLANGGGIAVSGTYPGFTLTATDQSITNEIQTIDTFSLSGQSLRASLSSDNQPAKVVTLPVVGINAGTNVTVSESSGVYTINASGGGGGTPTGNSGEIQFNSNPTGSFSASSSLVWNNSTNQLGIGTSSPSASLNIVKNGIGETISESAGLILGNTSFVANEQQFSPSITLIGSATKSGGQRATTKARLTNTSSLASGGSFFPRLLIQVDNGNGTYANTASFSSDFTSGIGGTGHLSIGSIAPASGSTLIITGYTQSGYSIDGVQINSTSSTVGADHLALVKSYTSTNQTIALNYLSIKGTINLTGTATAITRGVYVNPTLTSAPSWRSVEWTNSTGYGLYGSGSAANYLQGNTSIGTVTPSARLHVRGSGGTGTAMIVENGATIPENLLQIENSGKVGIKDSSPDYTLDVEGSVGAQQLNVQGATPTVTAYGTGASATITGGDLGVEVVYNTGTTPITSGTLFTVNYNNFYPNASIVVFSAGNNNAKKIAMDCHNTSGSNLFNFVWNPEYGQATLTPSTNLTFNFHIIGR